MCSHFPKFWRRFLRYVILVAVVLTIGLNIPAALLATTAGQWITITVALCLSLAITAAIHHALGLRR